MCMYYYYSCVFVFVKPLQCIYRRVAEKTSQRQGLYGAGCTILFDSGHPLYSIQVPQPQLLAVVVIVVVSVSVSVSV